MSRRFQKYRTFLLIHHEHLFDNECQASQSILEALSGSEIAGNTFPPSMEPGFNSFTCGGCHDDNVFGCCKVMCSDGGHRFNRLSLVPSFGREIMKLINVPTAHVAQLMGSNDYPDEDMLGAVRKSHQPTPMLKKSFPDNTTCRDDDPAIGETLVDPSAQPSQTDAIGSFDDETSVSKKVPISKKARHT
ncbi:hypothetical protein F2Q69_00021775 [Brassica cretica]|uniref:Uncharacterized protein n=1 Tax=Brassica cretica TaxID=69181 RepID=A0A8S9QDE2_BRACR|nr:hypothetical protein F2Q69_00021775 [Brassica cretica]